MRLFLFKVVAVHWMAVFAMLAIVCALDPHAGVGAPLRLLGMEAAVTERSGTESATFFAICFSLVAVFFLRAFVESFLDSDEQDGRSHDTLCNTFAAAALVWTLLLVAAASRPGAEMFGTIECLLAATLASYLAACAERRGQLVDDPAANGEGRDAARHMALGAAHSTLLSGLAGRTGDAPEGTR